MATEGVRQTMRKRGILLSNYVMSQQYQPILQQVIVGPNALPYQPFKRYRGNDPDKEPTVQEQRDDIADYCVARLTEYIRLQKKGIQGSVHVTAATAHPVLYSEREMARQGLRYNPSLALLYSTEGPMQEKHRDEEILAGTHRVLHPIYGAAGMRK